MHLIIKMKSKSFKCKENVGYRYCKNNKNILYINGIVYDKRYQNVSDLEFLDEIQANTNCISNYNGRFSGVLIDVKKRILTLFADRTGGSYLYYTIYENEVLVSDKMFTIASLGFPLHENRKTIATRLVYGYCLGNETYFDKMYTLRAGKIVNITLNGEITELNNDPIFKKNIVSTDSIESTADRIASTLEDAVRNILCNTKNPVATVTGGLDSRLLLGMAANAKLSPKTFGVDNDCGFDETQIAKQVSDFLNFESEFYYLDEDYYIKNMDECFLRNEFTCVMHVWFKPYENIQELQNTTVLMGIGGGEMLRVNNGFLPTQSLIGQDIPSMKEAILGYKMKLSDYVKEDIYAELEKVSRDVVNVELDKYFTSRRGLRDFYLDVNLYDAVDTIYGMYPGLNGISPYLDTQVLDIMYTLPCNDEYKGEQLYNLLYSKTSKELQEIDSTRVRGIHIKYPRRKYAYSYESLNKIFDTLLSDNSIIDREKTLHVLNEKLEKKDYTFGETELWLYSYLKMQEHVKSIKCDRTSVSNIFSFFNKKM